MSNRLALLLFLMLAVTISFGESSVDSVLNLVATTEKPIRKCHLLRKVSRFYLERSADSCVLYARRAYAVAKGSGYRQGEIIGLTDIGLAYSYLGNIDSSNTYYDKALNILDVHDDIDPKTIADLYSGFARLLYVKGDVDSSIYYLERGAALNIGDTMKSSFYSNLGIVYHQINNVQKALEFYRLSRVFAEKTGNHQAYSKTLLNEAIIYSKEFSNYKKAIELTLQAYAIGDSLGNGFIMNQALNGLATNYSRLNDFDLAYEYGLKSLNGVKGTGNNWDLSHTYALMAGISLSKGDYKISRMWSQKNIDLLDSLEFEGATYFRSCYSLAQCARLEGDFASAYSFIDSSINGFEKLNDTISIVDGYLEKAKLLSDDGKLELALEMAKEGEKLTLNSGSLSIKADVADYLAMLYKEAGNYELALSYFEQSKSLRDSIYDEEILRESTRLEANFKAQQREQALIAESEKEAIIYENHIKTEKNKKRTIAGLLVTLLLSTGVIFYVVLRQRIKRQLLLTEKNEQLRQLDDLRTRYFTNISHELRTPLSLILGPIIDLIQKAEEHSQDRRKLEIARKSGLSMLSLINEMLDLSKLKSGSIKTELTVTNLEEFMWQLVAPFAELAKLKRIDFKFDYIPLDRLIIKMDQKKVKTVMNNLMANAFKFTSEGGQINVMVDVSAEKEMVVKVRDTGKGIDSEELKHIFDAYYQASEGRNQQIGSGIGLALSKELTELLKGSIAVNSTLGKGTMFTLTLPMIEADNDETPILVQEQEVLESYGAGSFIEHRRSGDFTTVLLVEDHPDMSEYIKSILMDRFNVLTAGNGKEALRVLESIGKDVDIIVSDVMMPEMDGFELLENVRNDESLLSIPFIMLTAKSGYEDKVKGLLAGVDDYITKPFDSNELTVRLNSLVDKNNERSAALEAEENSSELKVITKADHNWLRGVNDILNKQIDNVQFSMPDLADELAMSERNLRYKLKRITGLSPNQLFREIKLTMAREYLDDGSYSSIAQVAAKVGFESAKHFSNIFKDRFGIRPAEYLKRNGLKV